MRQTSSLWKSRFAASGVPFDYLELGEPFDALYHEPLEIADELMSRRTQPSADAGPTLPPAGTAYSVGFYASGEFNAYATFEQDEALIAISAFVPPVIFGSCTAVAAGLEGMSGDAALQDGKLPTADDRAIWTGSVRRPPSSPDEWIRAFYIPANITSLQFDWAMRFYAIAMRFLVAHESMHVLLGHAGWLRNRHGVYEVLEFDRAEATRPLPLRDVIEFQADYNAAVSVTRGLLNGPTVSHLRQGMALPDDLTAIRFLFRGIVRALCILTHCFPVRAGTEPFARRPGHPHPYLRGRSILVAALAAAQEIAGVAIDYRTDVLQTFIETIALLETRTTIASWQPVLSEDAERMRTGGRHSEALHEWRQRHAHRAASYFYQWAPGYRLQDGSIWVPHGMKTETA